MSDGEITWAYDSETQEPGRGVGLTALLSAFLCAPFAVYVAVMVLRKSTDGLNRAMAVGGLVLSVGTVVGAAYLLAADGEDVPDKRNVTDMARGACLSIADLEEPGPRDTAEVVACSRPHDGQVLAVVTLTEADLGPDASDGFVDLCDAALSADSEVAPILRRTDLSPYVIYDETVPVAGDQIACIVVPVDGSQLTEPLFAT